MTLLIKLILAHLLADFLLQPEHWVHEKVIRKQRSGKLYLHVLVHGLLTFILVGDPAFWLPVVIIMTSHYFIDLAKVTFEKPRQKVAWFLTDQALHLLVISCVWYRWQQPAWTLQNIHTESVLIVITAVIFLTTPTSVIVRIFIAQWTPDTMYTVRTSLPDAGRFIGFLERLLVFAFILADHWEAVGFLLAAKSVFRFGDLKESRDRKLTEYVLIGTLLSFTIALMTARVTRMLLQNVTS